MSLLDGGGQTVTVYSQVVSEDADGTRLLVPSEVGFTWGASVQPQTSRSTPSGEEPVVGQQTTTLYRLRMDRGYPGPLGPWAKVSWQGRDWDVVGEPADHNSSPATARVVALIRSREAK